MSVVVVGSISLDTVETPYGKVVDTLGGSTTFFVCAASYFAPVKIVGVVGEDFPMNDIDFLKKRGADFSGLQVLPGKTFKWGGKYLENMNIRETLFTELNVFESFNPVLPESYKDTPYVFLANIQPDLQINVRRQVNNPKFVAMDTMNFWISGMLSELKAALTYVDLLTINDQEVQELSGENNVIKGARKILGMGPKALIIKRGEFGAGLVTNNSSFWIPAYPLEEFKDPTGAGDTFAGGFMGYLAMTDDVSEMNLRRAIIYGSALASFCVEDFSYYRLKNLTKKEINERYQKIVDMIKCEAGKTL